MRVSQISVLNQPKYYVKNKKNYCPEPCLNSPSATNLNFKGKFGAWVGGVFGAAAVVATAILAAPAAACLAGGGAIIGAIGGDVAEDAVNGDLKKD